jgi:hypothetical protein
MRRGSANVFAEDLMVATSAELGAADYCRADPRFSTAARASGYDAPLWHPAARALRCAVPRCFAAASTRCLTCRRAYCSEHGWEWSLAAGDQSQECERCARQRPRDALAAERAAPLLVAIGAALVFLLVVGLGIAVDVTARGLGLFAAAVFAGAFLVLAPHMER